MNNKSTRQDIAEGPALALLAQLPGQVAVVDGRGRILAVNDGWRSIAGENGLAIRRPDGFDYLAVCESNHDEDAEVAQAAAAGLRRVLLGAAPEFNLDYAAHAPRARRWFRMQAVPVAWSGKQAALVLHTDVTALWQAREEVLRLNASLERRVQRRTRELETANRELEAFSYSVSHDLKAPLAAIDGFTHVLSERLDGRLDEREAGYMQRVRAGVASMFTLVDAMLSLHQMSRPAPLRHSYVDISVLARTVLDELRATEPQRAVEAHIQPGIVLHCDAALIAIVLRNLIGNAWKFSARKPLTWLELALDADGPSGFTTVRLADHGAGFEPQLTSRLFAPFQRLHHSTEFPGTGIGLATVRRILNRHGGSIRADARPGVGATFWISLPSGFSESTDSLRGD